MEVRSGPQYPPSPNSAIQSQIAAPTAETELLQIKVVIQIQSKLHMQNK